MPDELLQRLRRFHSDTFPGVQEQFQNLVRDGQHPTILFIGCSDSRLVPYKPLDDGMDSPVFNEIDESYGLPRVHHVAQSGPT